MKNNTEFSIKIPYILPAKEEILGNIEGIRTKLSLELRLTPKQRKLIASIGKTRREIVRDVLEIAKDNPKMIKGIFNIKSLDEKVGLMQYFLELSCEADKLSKQLYDYYQIVGANAYKEASIIRKYYKSASEVNPAYKACTAKVDIQFSIYRSKKKETSNLDTVNIKPCIELSKLNNNKVNAAQ